MRHPQLKIIAVMSTIACHAASVPAHAQQQPEVAATPLPEIEVLAPKSAATKPKPKQAVKKAAAAKRKSPSGALQTPPRAEGEAAQGGETATGAVDGVVAKRSATATKTDTPLLETPQSISVVTADRVRQQGATTVNEALRYTAGVITNVYGIDTRYDWINIRGFDNYSPGIFLDGMMMRNNNGFALWKIEPYFAERIEVLKGPPSVLYGQASVGGLVNVVSKRPTEEAFNEVGVSFGSHQRLEPFFDLSGPATADGKLLYRLSGIGLDTDTQIDFANEKRLAIAPSLTWRPSAATSLSVLGQYSHKDSVPSLASIPAAGTLHPNPNGKVDRSLFIGEPGFSRFDTEQWFVGYQLDHKIDGIFSVRSAARYRETAVDYLSTSQAGLNPLDPTFRTVLRSSLGADESAKGFTTDNNLQAKISTGAVQHTLLAGIDFQYTRFDEIGTSGKAPSLDIFNPVYGQPIPPLDIYANAKTALQQTGVYLQEQAKIDNRWLVTLGGRYDWAAVDREDHLADTRDNLKDEAFTWKGAVQYLATNGLAPYYSYSESFTPTATIDPVTKSPFDPETGRQHEIGVKYEPRGSKALYTLAAFDIERQNYLSYEPDPPFTPRQAGEIVSRGIEFEATAELMPGLDLIAAYTWLPDFKITKTANPAQLGKRDPLIPEHAASLWLHYRIQEGRFAGVGFGGGARYFGETFGDLENSSYMKVDDFTLFDAVVDYEFRSWKLALNVSNLTDDDALKCNTNCFYGTGRTFLGTITYRW